MQLPEWSNGIGKHILKLEDGKYAVGAFRGEVVRFYQHWQNSRSLICKGRDVCPLCASTDESERKSTGRFRINFILKDSLEPMVFEGGKRVYDQLLMLNKDVPLEKAWIRIARTGTKTNTQFMIQVVPGEAGMIKAEDVKRIVQVKLHDISLNKEDEDASFDPETLDASA